MATQVILLERVDNLGNMGDVVAVKPGYARNYLLPQKKALRASKDNIAYFESQKKFLAAENDKRKAAAEKLAKKLEGMIVSLIRQASQSGQLFGSVNARDIAAEASAASGEAIARSMVIVNQNFKFIGLFPVEVQLHPEVKVKITVNIARSAEEAKTQAKTGKALISDSKEEERAAEAAEAALKEALDDDALKAELEAQEERKAEDAEEAAKGAERAEKRAKKKAAKAADAESEEETTTIG